MGKCKNCQCTAFLNANGIPFHINLSSYTELGDLSMLAYRINKDDGEAKKLNVCHCGCEKPEVI